jgi:hypothetical protein
MFTTSFRSRAGNGDRTVARAQQQKPFASGEMRQMRSIKTGRRHVRLVSNNPVKTYRFRLGACAVNET